MSSSGPKNPAPPASPPPGAPPSAQPAWIVVQPERRGWKWGRRLLWMALGVSLLFNACMLAAWSDYIAPSTSPNEHFHSGDRLANDKIALLKIHGTIMPPFTERLLKAIKRAGEDDAVKGILLEIDSPGGLVADSHEIYHRLRELNAKKPIAVQMKRMAASGGYYVAMGAGVDGRIFAEPTCWTGSIGVIIPRFDVSEAAKKLGVSSDPLKTGPLKDALSPFRELTPEERTVWNAILDDAFQRFQGVIREGRQSLTAAQVKEVATGQIFTADQAKEKGLIDEIGYEEDSTKWLKEKCGLKSARVITYATSSSLLDVILGSSDEARHRGELQMLLDAGVPRAFYHCSWAPALANAGRE